MKTYTKHIVVILSVTLGFISAGFGQRVEVPEKRTMYSTTYINPDDSYTTVISAGPVNYIDEKGKYMPINRNIVPSIGEYDLEVSQGLYHVYFNTSLHSEYPVVFETKDGANLKMKLVSVAYMNANSKNYEIIQKIQDVEPIISANNIVYPNAFDDIDVLYTYKDTRLKEEIWLSQEGRDGLPDPSDYGIHGRNAYLVFVTKLDLDAAPNVFAGQQKVRFVDFEGHDRIDFKNLRGDVKFFLPVDWAFRNEDREDLYEDIMLRIHRRLIHTPEGHFLLAGVRYSDLMAMPEGTIVFDPQVTLQPDGVEGYDTRITYKSNNPAIATYNHGVSDILRMWRSNYSSYHKNRTLIKFDLTSIGPSAQIELAELKLKCFDDLSTSYPAYLDVHKLVKYWDEGNGNGTVGYASWNDRTMSESWGQPGCQATVDYVTPAADFLTINSSQDGQWLSWTITDLASGWHGDASSNRGVLIKLRNDGDSVYRRFDCRSSDYSVEADRPKLVVDYTFGDAVTTHYVRDTQGNVVATYKE